MAASNWISGHGAGLTWTNAFGTEFTTTALAAGNAILSSIAITNGTALDMFADFSLSLASITPTGIPYIGVYLYPLNEDGSTYGDGRFGSAAAGPAGSSYSVGVINLVAAAGVQTGTLTQITIPPGTFKWLVYNPLTIATASSGNTAKYRTYNISFV